MSKKFMSFRHDPLRPMDFNDETKWKKIRGRSYKLVNPDMEKDRQFAYGEIKAVKALEEGARLVISGIANANIIDRMQERLDPIGCDIASYLKNAQLLAHHSYFHPIGQVDAIDIQDDGVHFAGWIGDPTKAPLTEMQKEIRSLVAQGILKTVSVGFIPLKVRAPLYNDQGLLEEPCVIEKWELLELSVVAVPCNQDSVFEMRSFDASGKVLEDNANDESLNDDDSEQQNIVAENSVSDKAKSKEISTEDHTEGVNIVAGKVINKEETTTDTKPADSAQEVLALVKGTYELVKRVAELCDLMMKKLEAKPESEKPTEDPEPEEKPEEEPAKQFSNRVTKLEKGFDKLVSSVNLLVEKLNK